MAKSSLTPLKKSVKNDPVADLNRKAAEAAAATAPTINLGSVAPSVNTTQDANGLKVFTNTAGRPSGITTPSGNTYFGASPEEVKSAQEAFNAQGTSMQGAKTVAEMAAMDKQQLALANAEKYKGAIGNIGQNIPTLDVGNQGSVGEAFGGISDELGANILKNQAIGAGIGAAGAVASVAGAPLAPVAAAGGAVLGTIKGVAEAIAMLKDEMKQNVKVEITSFKQSKNNIKAIIDGVNKGLVDPVDAVQLYNNELSKINAVERKLKRSSEADWLSKSKDELEQVESFNRYQKEATRQMLAQAILTPNPSVVLDLGQEVTTGETTE